MEFCLPVEVVFLSACIYIFYGVEICPTSDEKKKNHNYTPNTPPSYIVRITCIAYIIIINSPGNSDNKIINPNTENDRFCEADRNTNCRFSGNTTPVNRR